MLGHVVPLAKNRHARSRESDRIRSDIFLKIFPTHRRLHLLGYLLLISGLLVGSLAPPQKKIYPQSLVRLVEPPRSSLPNVVSCF